VASISLEASQAPASPYPAPRLAWATVAILLIYYMLAYLDRQILSLMAIPIQRDFQLDDVQVGLLNGFSFVLLYAFAGFVMGWMVDQFRRRVIVFGGVLIWSLSCIACGFADDFWTLFAARVGVGTAEAALVPAVYSMLRDLFPPSRIALANGVFVTGGSLGIGLSFALGGAMIGLLEHAPAVLPLVGERVSWQVAFILAGLPGLALCLLIFAVPEPARRDTSARASGLFAPLLRFFRERPRAVFTHLIGSSLSVTCSYSVFAWAPIYLGRRFALETPTIGLMLGFVAGPMAMVGSVIAGAFVDRWMRRGKRDIAFRFMACSLTAGSIACIFAFQAPLPLLFLFLLAINGFVQGANGGIIPASLQLLAPAQLRGQMGASYLLVSSLLGAAVGPVLIGALTEHVFHDRARVGDAASIVIGAAGLTAAALLWSGRHAYREAIAHVETS